ncbi:N-acetyltransferase [Desulfosarcina widdelii]|uniref:N-acetyltransferase n=1 Tax=Desulfosarcina widdelii TaxID=947919 RepID=A0A5K7Z9R7_9BACT|nr:GNAT family N-acetyltransferase [Desulfosarcina widdelii]BBO78762.1 N-acetyltransferase [Desulfosarcina widdelii]
MKNGFTISTDKNKLDVDTIHDYLCNRSYWGKGRTIEVVQKSIDHSLCFGVYDENDHFFGFARVVTDYTVFAYLMDLFILEPYRNRGIGKKLVDHIVNDASFTDIRFWRLDTMDAHGLYRKYGFKEPARPERIMEKRKISN